MQYNMDILKHPLKTAQSGINNYFQGKEPWQIVTFTTSSILILVWFHDFINQDESKTSILSKYSV